jgi:hypothetical protein
VSASIDEMAVSIQSILREGLRRCFGAAVGGYAVSGFAAVLGMVQKIRWRCLY